MRNWIHCDTRLKSDHVASCQDGEQKSPQAEGDPLWPITPVGCFALDVGEWVYSFVISFAMLIEIQQRALPPFSKFTVQYCKS